MKGDWYTEWRPALFAASAFLIIVNNGWIATLILWLCYIASGAATVKHFPTKENQEELRGQQILAVIVVGFSALFQLFCG